MATEQRPAHSPLGASGAERWMNCAGSVALLKRLDIPVEDPDQEPEYRSMGTTAHEAAAYCLKTGDEAWEIEGQTFGKHAVDKEMADAIQIYLIECLSDAEKDDLVMVETGIDSPDFHPDFFGTVDFARVKKAKKLLKIRDLKYGAGIAVDAEDNPQIMYYAYGILRKLAAQGIQISLVDLGIVQPRAFHPLGKIRTWTIPAEDLHKWANEVLKPAMIATSMEADLDAGPWCRFCPAKLVCPLMDALFGAAATADPTRVVELTDTSIGRSYQYTEAVKFYLKALQEETFRRLQAGHEVPGTKLVNKKANRVWKSDAETVLRITYGNAIYSKPEMVSPAEIDKLDGGKAKTAEWAYTPQSGLTVALLTDKRPAVKVKTVSETFAGVVNPT